MAAKYRVKGSFVSDRYYEDGEEVHYAGEPGDNLEPLNAEAKAAKGKVRTPAPPDVLA